MSPRPPETYGELLAFLTRQRNAFLTEHAYDPEGVHWDMPLEWWRALRLWSFREIHHRDPHPAERREWNPDKRDLLMGFPMWVWGFQTSDPHLALNDPMTTPPYLPGHTWEATMSSTWNLICVSHDPAIRLDGYDFADRASIERATRAAADEIGHVLAYHRDCDILAGRFSYPLIEVGCFGTASGSGLSPGCGGHHNGVNWVDVDVLRLVWAAHEQRGKAPHGFPVTVTAVGSAGWSVSPHTGGGGEPAPRLGGQGGAGGQGNVNYGGGGGGSGEATQVAIHVDVIPEELLKPFTKRCWTPRRMRRLLLELGIEQ